MHTALKGTESIIKNTLVNNIMVIRLYILNGLFFYKMVSITSLTSMHAKHNSCISNPRHDT